jgi:hypothetical protein
MQMVRMLLVCWSCLTLFGLWSSALAQDPPTPGLPPPMPAGLPGFFPPLPALPVPLFLNTDGGHLAAAQRDRCLDRIALDAARHAYVAAKLGLTAAQEELWRPIEAAFKKAIAARHQFCEALDAAAVLTPSPAPKAIAAELQIVAARLSELQEIQQWIAAFYESLSAEQRALFDAQHPGRP